MAYMHEKMPFTAYWYYDDVFEEKCGHCGVVSQHYLLRHRVYLGTAFPIIPTGTVYYTVCLNCKEPISIESEGQVAKILTKTKGRKPYKYNKFSEMELEGYDQVEKTTEWTKENLKTRIRVHINDIAKKKFGGHGQ